MRTNSTEDIWNNKEASNTTEEVEQYFPGFLSFVDSTEQQIPRPVDKDRRKMYYSWGKKKKHTVKNQLMVNKDGYILYKAKHKKGKRHDYDVYKKNHPVTPPQVVNVYDLGYLGVETDFPEQLSSHYHIKRKETVSYHKKKKRKQNSFQKENSNRTHYLSPEKIQNTEWYF
jgi:DDE superfamily endonuclease